MVGIKDFGMPSCCMNCEMLDGEYGNCDIIGDTQDFEYQYDENRPFDCPLVEVIPKADYENRLKADMVAMLTELKKEIEELDTPNNGSAYMDCADIIQQKIDALKGENT
jgi:hypothetical protein